ncbi:hypothetical protein ACWEPC_11480 [Nonomuraea sp. NPDC004297]
MYKAAIAAVTMTAAAMLLTAVPAIADDDFMGPHHGKCENEVAKLIKWHSPLVVWLLNQDCEHKDHHEDEEGEDERFAAEFAEGAGDVTMP